MDWNPVLPSGNQMNEIVSSGEYPVVSLLIPRCSHLSSSEDPPHCFPKWPHPPAFPPAAHEAPPSRHPRRHLPFPAPNTRPADRWEVPAPRGRDLHFPDHDSCRTSSHFSSPALGVFLEKTCIPAIGPFFNEIICFFGVELFFVCSGHEPLIRRSKILM